MNPSSGSGRPPVLLLIEDNPGDARLAKEAFSETTFADELHVVSDGDEALDFVNQHNEYTNVPLPDIILLDWHLPGMSGEDVLAELKNDQALKHIPVIVVTGSQADEEIGTAYDKYATACIQKPSDPDELIDAVRVFERFWLTFARLPNLAEKELGN